MMKKIYRQFVLAVAIAAMVLSTDLSAAGTPCALTFNDSTNCSGVCTTPIPNTTITHSGQVNISGATLFSGFFTNGASTIDFIDADNDGYSTQTGWLDQLAPTAYNANPAVGLNNTWWHVIYRGVGSGNGLAELVNYHDCVQPSVGVVTDYSYINRNQYAAGSTPVGVYCATNTQQGGCPVIQNKIDLAVMDVPTPWFVMNGQACNATVAKTPATEGYGQNPIKAWDANQSNQLKTLGGLSPSLFVDNPIAWVTMAYVANPGTGLSGNVTKAQLEHLFATGRMPNGENLVAATRDSGSGTRNGAMNSIGIDPSWGRGDNINLKADNATLTQLGASHTVCNLGSASRMTEAVAYNRLAVGYNGLDDKAIPELEARRAEILGVEMSPGSGTFVRPTANRSVGGSPMAPLNVIANNGNAVTSYRIGGAETFVSMPTYISCSAQDYLDNILASISAIEDVGGIDPDNYGSPGEFLALNFTLVPALEMVPGLTPTSYIANPNFNAALNAGEVHVWQIPAYGYCNAGVVPTRANLSSGTYSDGTTGLNYIAASGATISEGSTLDSCMRVAGDMDNDGDRDTTDLTLLVQHMPTFGNHCTYAPAGKSTVFCAEITADFNGDGNLDAKDVRYFADGLILVGGKLNRQTGFSTVDTAFGGNYFGTVVRLNGGAYTKTYANGDSRGDIAGATYVAPGADPRGSDGYVDEKDIDYLLKVLSGGLKCEKMCSDCSRKDVRNVSIDLTDLSQAVWADYSCDMNGDLVLDYEDYRILVEDIIGRPIGDLNFDGKVDAADVAIITAHLGQTGGYLQGDINGDGKIDASDLDAIYNIADLNKDGKVDMSDFSIFAENWLDSLV
jgi:hypothetical protein